MYYNTHVNIPSLLVRLDMGNNTEFALIIMYGLCFFASYIAPNNYKVVMKSHCISESLVM